MALAAYKLCDLCGAKAFYDECISDPHYLATYDETESCDPIGLAVLCSACHQPPHAVLFLRDAQATGEE